ncbi:polyprenyl synthetase family protein [Rhizosphaericola mali]|uniref:Polyprenyl synthetase family protein n=1 Tax=Rhizosphaericola mali TaxID=2545455 RepID=A0A5P2G8D5_9BACT|nr:polyprenyl synthetase family protein [Rhizosphaericola mali]QES90172.1 polyprenyl synthetase family protein [Rhizosphaericola mali]
MSNVPAIIAPDLKAFNSYLSQQLKNRIPLLEKILKYIIKQKGKQMRPMFVLLCARLGGEISEPTFRAATLVELLHTATLIHDDVVDEAEERRGLFSINAIWKNKVAVLAGDFLLSKGLLISLENDDFKTLKILAQAVSQMSEGELLQIEKSRKLNLDENIYYDIIKGKTASLIASACSAGAYSTFKTEEDAEKLRSFGEKVGMAFQIKDDLFDYGSDNVGKPTANDIKEKKLTLPLIYTLNNCEASLRKKIIYIIKNKNTDKDAIQFVLDAVNQCKGLEYATQKMFQFRDEALQILQQYPVSETRDALEQLVRYTTDRKF